MIRGIVTDIEGTTTSLSFVKDVLFPYARARVAEFVRNNAARPDVNALLDDVRTLAGDDLTDEQVITQLQHWIDEDRKITPLKSLQGLLWEQGYRDGAFRGHVYRDAVEALRDWRRRGMALYVYSSGSVQAQKLLYGHSDHGDLSTLFDGFFDTRVGAKTEADSYRTIAVALQLPPASILFLSDSEPELDAARAAGMQTCWLRRDGELDARAAHRQVRDFTGISLRQDGQAT